MREYNVPERLLQIFLSNYQRNAGTTRRQNLIAGEVEEGAAEAINLSATFANDIGPAYSYDVVDKLKLDNAPPAYVQITRAPKHGSIVAKKRGEQVVLQKGDLVPASAFKNFVYD